MFQRAGVVTEKALASTKVLTLGVKIRQHYIFKTGYVF